jgi:hypothetical protein
MLNLDNAGMKVFIHIDNKKFEVRGIFNSVKEANVFCVSDPNVPDVGVICQDKTTGLIFVADIEPATEPTQHRCKCQGRMPKPKIVRA